MEILGVLGQKTIRVIEARPGGDLEREFGGPGAGTGQRQLWGERTGEPPAATNSHVCGCRCPWGSNTLAESKSAELGSAPGTVSFTCNEGVAISDCRPQAPLPGLREPQDMLSSEIPHCTRALLVGQRAPPSIKSVKFSALKSSKPCLIVGRFYHVALSLHWVHFWLMAL